MATQSDPQSSFDTENEVDLVVTSKKRSSRTPFSDLSRQRFCDHRMFETQTTKFSLHVYSSLAGINKPYRILVDGSIILLGIDLEEVRVFLDDPDAEIFTTACVKKEIGILSSYIDLSESNVSQTLQNIQLCSCSHEARAHYDDCIVQLIGAFNDQKFVLLTASNTLIDLLDDNVIKVPVVKLQNGRLFLKPPSLLGKTTDFQKLMLSNQTLNQRIREFRFLEKKTGVGGDSFFRAISELLSLGGHQKVRKEVSRELDLNRKLYNRKVKQNYTSFVKGISEPGSWANAVVIQAVADLYAVGVVVLLSYEDQLLFEWFPGDSNDIDKHHVIFLSYLDGYRYGALYPSKHIEECSNHLEEFAVDRLYLRCGLRLDFLRYEVSNGKYRVGDDGIDEDRLYVRLKRRLETYRFSEKEVLKDGNDCFRILSSQLDGSENKHDKVRQLIYKQLLDHPEKYLEQVYNDYVDNMSVPTKWANGTVLQACADAYGCKIFSLSSAEEEIGYEYGYKSEAPSCLRDVYLVDAGIHNNAMVHQS